MTSVTRYSPSRVVAVTFGLSATGALLGGTAGAAALGIGLLLTDGLEIFRHLNILLIPGIIGAVLGSFCAPLAGWLLLRRVPLGRAFASLVAGTVLGGLAGWFFPLSFDPVRQPIVTAAAGFLAASVLMRLKYRGQSSQRSEPGVGAT